MEVYQSLLFGGGFLERFSSGALQFSKFPLGGDIFSWGHLIWHAKVLLFL